MDKDVTVIDGVDDLIRELRRQGNNLNQLVVMARQGHVELVNMEPFMDVYMNAYGYDVKWEPHQKYITYTTPENIRCRDSKLFDQTLKRENMELYFRLGGADYLQACREIAYDHREPTPTLEDAVCGMAGTVAAICALCEDEDSEVSDLARELYYSSLLLQELVEWYQSRRQEQENYEEEYGQYHGSTPTQRKNDHAVTKECLRCAIDNFLLTLPISDSY